MQTETEHDLRPFIAGIEAFRASRPIHENPFTGPHDRADFVMGYRYAQKLDCAGKEDE